jgi:hypothetical protein
LLRNSKELAINRSGEQLGELSGIGVKIKPWKPGTFGEVPALLIAPG